MLQVTQRWVGTSFPSSPRAPAGWRLSHSHITSPWGPYCRARPTYVINIGGDLTGGWAGCPLWWESPPVKVETRWVRNRRPSIPFPVLLLSQLGHVLTSPGDHTSSPRRRCKILGSVRRQSEFCAIRLTGTAVFPTATPVSFHFGLSQLSDMDGGTRIFPSVIRKIEP